MFELDIVSINYRVKARINDTIFKMINLNYTSKFLNVTKYFGLRFLFYKTIKTYPYFKQFLLDLVSPKLVNRMISNKFIDHFNGEQGQGVNVKTRDYPGLGMIHYSLIRTLKPKKVLIIGSLKGYIPSLCALACQDNIFGSVDFIDAGFDDQARPDQNWGQDGFWKKNNPLKHFKQMKLERIKTFVMLNTEFASMYKSKKFDYIYIDGDHTYEGVKLDYDLFWPMLKPGGIMTFHDILGKGSFESAKFGVEKFWRKLSKKHKITLSSPKESGLGILQKPLK
jgi:predicted O-methyltransferase YrrM